MKFRVVIEQDKDGVFIASCPTLPGCVSDGRTFPTSLRNLAHALDGVLSSMDSDGQSLSQIDGDVFLAAVEQLLFYRKSLDFIPVDQRLQHVTRSALSQARILRQRVEQSLNMSSSAFDGALAPDGDGLQLSSTYADLVTAVDSWIIQSRQLNPEIFDASFIKPSPASPQPFGFGLERRTPVAP